MVADTPIIKGIYAITPEEADTNVLVEKVEACIRGGANLIQYRAKQLSADLRYIQAECLKILCDKYNTPLIINDDIELCLHLNAFGVHLGAKDDNITTARKLLGPHKIIGISCYNDWKRVEKAVDDKADYIALGACFPSLTKPAAPQVKLEMIAEVIKKYQTPVVAIGGLDLKNVDLLIQQGVECVALINSLFKEKNIETVTQKFSQLFIKY
jgi:thiamine-phosphate pyrophosphorylase